MTKADTVQNHSNSHRNFDSNPSSRRNMFNISGKEEEKKCEVLESIYDESVDEQNRNRICFKNEYNQNCCMDD
jgi:hypothetical protein